MDTELPTRFVSRLTRDTVALILAGGRGSRLKQLTLWRAKPAVPFGGKFRIIDFPLSNCLNSGIRRVAVITQYKALLDTEAIDLLFDKEAVRELARIASDVNERMENIGARRLHTVMEKLLDEISFEAPDMSAKVVTINKEYVVEKLEGILEDENLSRYIL